MIITKTPLRVSLFGGGTDFPEYFNEYGGLVLTGAIDKYVYVIIKSRYDELIRVGYSQTELVNNVNDLKHELIRECLGMTGMTKGIEVGTMADVSGQGSGLGSSSAVTVGTLLALETAKGHMVNGTLAKMADTVERVKLARPIGLQDQYIVTYGGFRAIEFHEDDILVEKNLPVVTELNKHLLLFNTGQSRQSASVLTEQKAGIANNLAVLHDIQWIARSAYLKLKDGNWHIWEELRRSWELKKRLASNISNPLVDLMYKKALKAGASGGKLCGAGGGGYLLLFVYPEYQEAVREAVKPLEELPFKFGVPGSTVVFNDGGFER